MRAEGRAYLAEVMKDKPPREKPREVILNKASALIVGDRNSDYGDPLENHARIANLWQVVLGIPIRPDQAALCMALVKVARLVHTPDHEDSWIDAAGYFAIGGEIAGSKT